MQQICNFCKKPAQLIKSHIVPACFLKGQLNNITEKAFLEVSTKYSHTKKRLIGPYDKNILCLECDRKIGVYDDYAKALLIDNLADYRNNSHPFYLIPKDKIDFVKLKKFFISLIWRASISSEGMFNQVLLGSYNNVALASLKNETELEDDIFSVLIFKDAPYIKYQDTITFSATKLAEKKAYKIHFSGYQITVIPKANDMKWNIKDGTTSPSEFFFRKGQDLVIFEVDDDLSGKSAMLKKVYSKLKKINKKI